MNYLKNWSTLVVVLILGMFMTSCDKDQVVDNDQTTAERSRYSNLGFGDFEVGVKYPIESVSDKVLRDLQINRSQAFARTINYRVRLETTPSNCVTSTVTKPDASQVTWDDVLLLTLGPCSCLNGTYVVNYTGSGGCSDQDTLVVKIYHIDNGDFSLEYMRSYVPKGPGGSTTFGIGGDGEYFDP
ncbi:MAG: hypothetical protein KDC53_24235 [Saprospiraceae bacterium]|nr:hypothetical protein [Saprospiraceae bacterium]